jgi:hypothetical protein
VCAALLVGCSAQPTDTAVVGIARSQGDVMIALVRVCSGEVAGIQLLAEARTSPVFSARPARVTVWTSPEPVRLVGETDLIGDTSWATGPPVRAFDESAVYLMSAVSSSGASVGESLRFSSEAFAGIGVEQVLTADRGGVGSRYLSMADFVTTACDLPYVGG